MFRDTVASRLTTALAKLRKASRRHGCLANKDYILVLLFAKYVSDRYTGDPNAVIVVPEGGSFAEMVKCQLLWMRAAVRRQGCQLDWQRFSG